MRTDDKLIAAYYALDRTLTPEEVVRLFQLLRDPWHLNSGKNRECLDKYIYKLKDSWYLDADNPVLDIGSGLGTFAHLCYKRNIIVISVDYKEVIEAAGFGSFNAPYYGIGIQEQQDLIELSQRLDYSVVHYMNSSYYIDFSVLKETIIQQAKKAKRFIFSTAGSADTGVKLIMEELGWTCVEKFSFIMNNDDPRFNIVLVTCVYEVAKNG